MANNKFKAAIKKAKALYRTGRYKKFSDAVKAAYKKVAAPRRKKSLSSRSVAKRTKRRIGSTKRKLSSRSAAKRTNPKKQLEKKLGNALLEHWKTQSIKRTKQLDSTISGLKKKLRSL